MVIKPTSIKPMYQELYRPEFKKKKVEKKGSLNFAEILKAEMLK